MLTHYAICNHENCAHRCETVIISQLIIVTTVASCNTIVLLQWHNCDSYCGLLQQWLLVRPVVWERGCLHAGALYGANVPSLGEC